jgi:hypothetical protein
LPVERVAKNWGSQRQTLLARADEVIEQKTFLLQRMSATRRGRLWE